MHSFIYFSHYIDRYYLETQSLEMNSAFPVFFNLQSCTEVLGHFCIFGAFSSSHRPNPSPHPTNKVESMYPEFFSEF